MITHFTRFHNYDYSRGAVFFLTFHLEPRFPVFGAITPDGIMQLSPVGKALDETILKEDQRNSGIILRKYCIMPEHLHIRISMKKDLEKPLHILGKYVGNIKRWSQWRAASLNCNITWQENYHDRICTSEEIIARVDSYVEQNPMKWALMHGPASPMGGNGTHALSIVR